MLQAATLSNSYYQIGGIACLLAEPTTVEVECLHTDGLNATSERILLIPDAEDPCKCQQPPPTVYSEYPTVLVWGRSPQSQQLTVRVCGEPAKGREYGAATLHLPLEEDPYYQQMKVSVAHPVLELRVQLGSTPFTSEYGFLTRAVPFRPIDLRSAAPFGGFIGPDRTTPDRVPEPPRLRGCDGLQVQGTVHGIVPGADPKAPPGLWCSVLQVRDAGRRAHVTHLQLFDPSGRGLAQARTCAWRGSARDACARGVGGAPPGDPPDVAPCQDVNAVLVTLGPEDFALLVGQSAGPEVGAPEARARPMRCTFVPLSKAARDCVGQPEAGTASPVEFHCTGDEAWLHTAAANYVVIVNASGQVTVTNRCPDRAALALLVVGLALPLLRVACAASAWESARPAGAASPPPSAPPTAKPRRPFLDAFGRVADFTGVACEGLEAQQCGWGLSPCDRPPALILPSDVEPPFT